MRTWRELPAPNRRWLVVNALLVTAVINALVNWLIALAAAGGHETVPMWGAPLVEPSIFWDLIGTLLLLPLITGALTTAAIHRDLRRGALEPLGESFGGGRGAVPGWQRGAELGGVALAGMAPPLLLILAVLGFPELGREAFVAWHTAFAVVLGALVTPPLAILAMADPVREDGGR
jgi:hypothetical protein